MAGAGRIQRGGRGLEPPYLIDLMQPLQEFSIMNEEEEEEKEEKEEKVRMEEKKRKLAPFRLRF